MREIFDNAKREFVKTPIGVIGSLAAVAAVVWRNPEIVNVFGSSAPEETGRNGNAGIVTWLLLYTAICFLFSRWGSALYENNEIIGCFFLPVFGLIATCFGVYLASVYLSAFPLLEKGEVYVSHSWINLPTPLFALIVVGIWGFMSLGSYLAITEGFGYDSEGSEDTASAINMDGLDSRDTSAIVLLIFSGVSSLFLWIVSHALIFALVETVRVSP